MMFWINYLLWHYFGKNKGIYVNKDITIYLSDNFPFFVQGKFTGHSSAFVNRVEYKNTDINSYKDTEDVMKHEYAHLIQRNKYGFWKFWFMVCRDYAMFWVKHDDKFIEKEANQIKNSLSVWE